MALSHPLLPPTLLGYLLLTLLLVKEVVNNGHTLHPIILSACYIAYLLSSKPILFQLICLVTLERCKLFEFFALDLSVVKLCNQPGEKW